MKLFLYFLGCTSLFFGVFIILSNVIRQIINFRDRGTKDIKHHSIAPFFGPIFVIAGYIMLPFEFSNLIFFVILLDPDTLMAVLGIGYFIKGMRK